MAARNDSGKTHCGDGRLKIPGLANVWHCRFEIGSTCSDRNQDPGRDQGLGTGARSHRTHWGGNRAPGEGLPGAASAYSERVSGGRYLEVRIDRGSARHGLSIANVQSVVASAIGGENIAETVEGLQRFPINAIRGKSGIRSPICALFRSSPTKATRYRSQRWRASRCRRASMLKRERALERVGLRRHSRARSRLIRRGSEEARARARPAASWDIRFPGPGTSSICRGRRSVWPWWCRSHSASSWSCSTLLSSAWVPRSSLWRLSPYR